MNPIPQLATPRQRASSPANGLGIGGASVFAAIMIGSLIVRTWKLGRLSFWYDEVVTMRLARVTTPAALVELLSQIDATRAPLHPLLLQGWIRLFGASEIAARSLSVVCGVLTLGLVWWVGRLVFDPATGLCAAWLSALCPPLVYYAREARMYALLVTLTCLCWGLLFSLRRSAHWARLSLYALGLAALVYTHPLGILMAGTLALASLLPIRCSLGWLGWRGWLCTHGAALLIAAPWVGRYFDHSPEFLSGHLPIKFLLGTPIGFIGGSSVALGCFVGLIVFGFVGRRATFAKLDDWVGPACLVVWMVVPPAILYAYSWMGSPIFGPARYTLFVAPAYLILVAQGLYILPPLTRSVALVGASLLQVLALGPMVYSPNLKADWRACSAAVAARMATHPGERVTFVVMPPEPGQNHEVETARYYLPETCRVIPWREDLPGEALSPQYGEFVYLSLSLGREPSGKLVPSGPTRGFIAGALLARYPGLVVYGRSGLPPRRRPSSREPAASAK
jgi:hypothetical protein